MVSDHVPGFLEPEEEPFRHPDKLCPACRRVLFYGAFDTNQWSSDGYYTYCKDCRAQKAKEKAKPPPTLDTVPTPAADPQTPLSKIPPGILNGIRTPETVEQPMEGVWSWNTPKGWRVVAVHYTADPDKRPGTKSGDDWIKLKKADSSERDWKREYELDHTISEGEPFYATFNRRVHVQRCVYDPTRPLLRGWDFGRAHPAVVIGQLDDKAKLRILFSQIYTNLTIFQLAPIVLAETAMRFPDAKVRDYGDPAGSQETDKGATTMILLQHFKITLNYRFSWIEEGTKMIDQKLRVQEDGLPGLLIDPENNDELIEGFESGYLLDTGASGKDKEGRLKNSPKKDGWFDHVLDALRYMVVNLFTMLPDAESEQDKAWEKIGLWRTNEQHAARKADQEPLEEFSA